METLRVEKVRGIAGLSLDRMTAIRFIIQS